MSHRSRVPTRRQGITLTEVVAAAGLAVVLIGAYAGEVARQHHELAAARDVARAAAALRDAHERALAGALSAPGPGEVTSLAAVDDLSLTVRRAEAASELEGLVPVVVRAEWRGRDGRPAARELVTLAAAREERGR